MIFVRFSDPQNIKYILHPILNTFFRSPRSGSRRRVDGGAEDRHHHLQPQPREGTAPLPDNLLVLPRRSLLVQPPCRQNAGCYKKL